MKSKFEIFNELLSDLYSCRDEYSRCYIIEHIRSKYNELHPINNGDTEKRVESFLPFNCPHCNQYFAEQSDTEGHRCLLRRSDS